MTNDERPAELLPIRVQQLYVLSVLGKIEQAEKLASEFALEESVIQLRKVLIG